MNVGIIAQGSNGDIEMMVSLALGLIKKNHDVELFIITINDRDYSFLSRYEGLTIHQKHIHAEFKKNDVEFWDKPEESQNDLFISLHYTIRHELLHFSSLFAKEKDMVIGSHHLYELSCMAEKFDTPYVAVNFPLEYIRTDYEPPFSLSHLKDMDNIRLWDIFESYYNVRLKRGINRFRKRNGMSPIKNALHEVITSNFLNLVPYSKHLYKAKQDLKDNFYICGVLKSCVDNNTWQPPQLLLDFIDREEKPVFITLGSMAEHENDVQHFQQLLLSAAHQVNRKVIILSQWPKEAEPIQQNVYKLSGFISYPEILSRCSVVVHHGGIGTSHHAVEAGCPSVVIPYGFDQPFNARLLYDLGVSNGSIKRKDLTAAELSRLILEALQNNEMKQRAEKLATLLRYEDNVASTVQLIEMKMKNIPVVSNDIMTM
jgi:UDP:flavonoid glycosyltransferase YjiC (YdhE family)